MTLKIKTQSKESRQSLSLTHLQNLHSMQYHAIKPFNIELFAFSFQFKHLKGIYISYMNNSSQFCDLINLEDCHQIEIF